MASNGNLTLRDTTVSGGAGSGGIRNSGTLTLTNSTVSGNSAGSGGGVLNFGTLTMTNSTVSGNSAAGFGGGIRNSGTLTMTDSTVSGNTAGGFGGGGSVFSYGGTVKLTNSTVSGNSAPGDGGGVLNYYRSTLALINSTVSGNTAGDRGGGVFNGGGQGGHSALFLIQTLVSGNSAFVAAEALGPEVFNSGQTGHIVIADNFNLFGHDGLAGVVGFTSGPKDNVSSGPLAAILNPVLGDNGGLTLTHALVAGSPAVDGIPAASCATTIDQRGIVRPQDGDQLLRKPKRCPVERAGIDEGARADPIRRRRYQHPGG